MESKTNKSINYYMRALHRDIGFFVIGLTIIYSISGVILMYRNTDFLKQEQLIVTTLSPNLEAPELGMILHQRNFKIAKVEGDSVYFKNGVYNKTTGAISYSKKELPSILNRFSSLHTLTSQKLIHLFLVIYGVLLLFLAISSFWMFSVKSKLFRRGIYFASIGIVFAVVLLFVC